jgi:hypothetical protein
MALTYSLIRATHAIVLPMGVIELHTAAARRILAWNLSKQSIAVTCGRAMQRKLIWNARMARWYWLRTEGI